MSGDWQGHSPIGDPRGNLFDFQLDLGVSNPALSILHFHLQQEQAIAKDAANRFFANDLLVSATPV